MNFTDFPERNHHFGKPRDWKDEHCGTLPVWVGNANTSITIHVPEGTPLIFSKWLFTDTEKSAIAKGEIDGVYLCIIGSGMPPVSLFTQNPFVNADQQQEPEAANS